MAALKIKECIGFNKDEAFADLDFLPNFSDIPGSNCTQAWKKAGSPIFGTKAFKVFAVEQLAEKTKNIPGLGLYIVVKPPQLNDRKKPYKVINNVVDSTRIWTNIQYEILEAEVDLGKIESEEGTIYNPIATNYGKYIDTIDNKAEALQKLKDLTADTGKDYILRAIKLPDRAPIAAYAKYTPSEGTEQGQYIAFGYSKDDLD